MAIRKASASTAKNRGVIAAVGTVANPATGANPIIIGTVSVTDASYNVLDDTALGSSGGYLKITGTGFRPGCTVYVGGTAASSTTYVSPTEVRAATPVISSATHFVTVVNSDNTVGIKLSAIVVSGTPSWSTGTTLTQQVDSNSFSIQLTATSDSSVTYSLAAGSSVPSGTTLYSNGLFTGNVSGLSADTTYSFDVNAIDAELQDTSRTFSVTVVRGDPLFNIVPSLINGESNTWITDASSNSFQLTVTGDTRPNAFGPYNTSWSAYMDGTGDYVGGTCGAIGAGDFTIEFWSNQPAATGRMYYFTTGTGPEWGEASGVSLLEYDGFFAMSCSTQNSITVRTNATRNQWNHIAVVRSNGVVTLYYNGVAASTTLTTSANLTGTLFRIGSGNVNSGSWLNYAGYMSDFRIVVGTAVYTTNFTPPTSKLTAIAGTRILLLQDNRVKDVSGNTTNSSTITVVGDTATKTFGPFGETDTTTGSGYFDGTGDYLSVANTSVVAFGTGPYSIEFWYWGDGTAQVYQPVISTGSGGFRVFVGYSSGVSLWNGATPLLNPFGLLKNAWNFIQIVRSSTATNGLTITLNGTTSTGTDATNWGAAAFNIGFESASAYLTGYLADLRISNTARSVAIPTSSFTADANTKLLVLQNRIGDTTYNFIDESGFKSFIARNGDAHQGSFSPYSPAGWSGYFDGTGDYLTTPANTAFSFGTGDFTMEAFIYMASIPASAAGQIIAAHDWTGASINFGFRVNATTGYLAFYDSNTSFAGVVSSTAVPTNTWVHVAAVKASGTITIYQNGVSMGSAASAASIPSTVPISIGHSATGGSFGAFTGYISNVRIVKGLAVYTGTFTPPTALLQATQGSGTNIAAIASGTSLLTLQDNRFKDNSSNAFTISKTGDAKIQAFSPFRATVQYSPTTHGGSVYFDGTGDYLDYNSPTGMTLGTADFIIEYWIYSMASATAFFAFDCRNGSDGAVPLVYYDGTSFVYYVNTAARITSTAITAYGQWTHVVVSRVSGSTRMFINGVVQSTVYADSTSYIAPGSTRPRIGLNGLNGGNPATGFVSGLRVVKDQGVTSVTVPTSPPAITGNTVLYAAFNNAGPVDVTGRNNIGGYSGTRNIRLGSTAKYGKGSLYFTGSYQWAFIGPSGGLAPPLLPTIGDYTVECWVYCTASDTTLMCLNTTTAVYAACRITLNSTGSVNILVSNNSPNILNSTSATGVFSFNTWQHIAFVRYGGTHSVYVNGTSVIANTTIAATAAVQAGTESVLGCIDNRTNSDFASFYQGYIDEFRVTRSARYTANFTPPNAAFYIK